MRILAAISQDPNLVALLNSGEDVFKLMALKLSKRKKNIDEISKKEREIAKRQDIF